MTQRDNAAVMASDDSPESDERQSTTRALSPVSAVDEPPSAALRDGAASETSADCANASHLQDGAEAARVVLPAVEDEGGPAGRGVRPTLMGLAPIDSEEGAEANVAAREERAERDADADDEDGPASHAMGHAAAAPGPVDGDDDCDDDCDDDEDEYVSHATDHAVVAPAPVDNDDEDALSTEPVVPSGPPAAAPVSPVSMASLVNALMPVPERTDDEGDSEWLDLSTRWLIATGPQDQPLVDDNEVTDHEHWAERLAARVFPQAQLRSSAPVPPPQPVQRVIAQPARRHATIAHQQPVQPDEPRSRGASPTALSAQAGDALRPQWSPSRRRHSTLAGFSALPDDAGDREAPRALAELQVAPSAAEVADSEAANAGLNPWREEPSYTTAPRAQPLESRERRPQSPTAASAVSYATPPSQAAAVSSAVPPWAATMAGYAIPPEAAMQPPPLYAAPTPAPTWSAAPAAQPMPPWAATINYGVPQRPAQYPQYFPPATYPHTQSQNERASRYTDYPAPQRAARTGTATGTRSSRPAQRQTGELSREQWKDLADTWLATLGKCAIAAMALHYSGLAEPVLGYFGYAPAAPPVSTASAGVSAPAPRAVAPSTASIAAVGSSPAVPPSAAPEQDLPDADEPLPARRRAPRREAIDSDDSVASSSAPRRHNVRAARKPRHAPAVRGTPAGTNGATARDQAEANVATLQPTAAGPADDEALGEAFLRINSRPWAQVFVDGTHVGNTPKIDMRVRPGAHRIRLVNPELNVSKTFEMTAVAGETVSRVEQLDE